MEDLRQRVWEHCCALLEARIARARKAMDDAQEAANSNDKSSAGDKYETSRAMGQLDRDMNAKQMAEAQAELAGLLKLRTPSATGSVVAGSLVHTDQNYCFIGAGLGVIEVDGKKIAALSARAPLALALSGKKVNDSVNFNGRMFRVLSVY